MQAYTIKTFFAIGFLFCLQFATAQQLFMARNLEKAYQKGTRTTSGAPGKTYWQNKGDYQIKVKITPKTRLLEGSARITYINNSPDTLKMLPIKINQDLYKKGGQRANDLTASDIEDGGVKISRLLVNGAAVPKADQTRAQTILAIQLANGIMPGASTLIDIDWSFIMPAGEDAPRTCVCDPTTYFVAYWYPQVAVYDDLHGWNTTPYTGMQEFYNDFNDYHVEVTVPNKMMVWATGELQNAEKLLTKTYLDRWNQAHQTEEIVKIWTADEMVKGGVFQKAKQNTFVYVAKSVPDFAFAASDHYHWDATQVRVTEKPPVGTFVSAAYHDKSEDYRKVAAITADGIRLMSSYLPGYPFPYPSMTVFNGNDGMEYPMMCNDASTGKNAPTQLTVHEVSHTYFPFMMGINEQMYAWMDEGWASFFDYQLVDSLDAKYGGSPNIRGYSNSAGNEWDVPPMVQSRFLSSPAYRTAAYVRPQAAYLGLLDLLGYEQFNKCMVTYMDRWKGKHPSPYDFFNTWNDASGQNLNWYWKPWFFEWGYPDLAVADVINEGKTPRMEVKMVGNIPVPIHAVVTYTDGSNSTIHKTSDVWKDGRKSVILDGASGKSIRSVMLGLPTIPDVNAMNNTWGGK